MNYEDALLRTVQAVEAVNLTEVLPIDILGWYDQKRSAELDAEEKGKTEALRFLERRVEHWRHIATAE
jgi:hypothetical protein